MGLIYCSSIMIVVDFGDFLEVAGGSWNMGDIFLHFLFFQGKMGGAAYSPDILW